MTNQQARSFLDSVAGYANGTSSGVSSADKPVLIGTIDVNYTSGPAKVVFDGETVVSGRGYAWVAPYVPTASDRVVLVPVGQSYVIIGLVKSTLDFINYVPLTLQNGWVTYTSTPGWGPARVTRTVSGAVKLTGMIMGGTITSGTVLFNLPAPFRPLVTQDFLIFSSGAGGGIEVRTNGDVAINGPASSTYISLDNVVFNNDTSLTWNNAALTNGWVVGDGSQMQYAKDTLGRLWFRGYAKNPTTPVADQVIFNMPAGYRTEFRPHVANLTSAVTAYHELNSTGDYIWKNGSGTTASAYWIDQGIGITAGAATWTNATLLNGWIPYDVAQFSPGRYYKDADGMVHLQGLIKAGTVGAVVLTLPVGYRPKFKEMFATISNSALGRADVWPDGSVVAQTASASWFSLDGVSFPAEN